MKKILVHLHIYYPHLYEELKSYLKNVTDDFDLYVTMVEEHEEIIEDLKKNFKNVNIMIVENRGYDVGPFIEVLNQVNLDDYSYIIKLHTKRDITDNNNYLLNGFCVAGNLWRKELLSFLKDYKKTISKIQNNHKIGMIGGSHIVYSNKIEKKLYQLQQDINNIYQTKIGNIPQKSNYNFIAGTMFIVKADLFKKLQNKFKLKDFEKPQKEPTLAHKFERIFGIIICYSGYKVDGINNVFLANLQCLPIKLFRKYKKLFFVKKITHKNRLIIKIFKIPICNKKINKYE